MTTATIQDATATEPLTEPRLSGGVMSPSELEPLMRAFNDVTARLTAAHESLTSQVERLKLELSEANRQVRQTKHLAMLGEMAAGIAHEVRNPLGSIMLYARQLEHDLTGEQRGTASKIASAVGRLDIIVRDVLAFSRENRVRRIAVGAGELLHAAADAARGDSPVWAGMTVTGPGANADTIDVVCDPGMLHQALVNVIRNAAEMMHEHGCVKRVVELNARERAVIEPDGSSRRMVSLTVRDHGPGVRDEDAAKMFTPFFTTRAAGTGLGLAIVHRIIDAHGGRVSISNVAARGTKSRERGGGGAVVEFLLPVAADVPAQTAE